MNTRKIVNVLHIIGGMNRGGAETFLMNVMKNIDTSTLRFVLVCYGDAVFDYEEEISRLNNVQIVKIPDVKSVGVWAHVMELRRIIKEYKIDVVHAHTYYNSVFSLLAARIEGVRLRIAHSHNTRSESSPSLIKKVYFAISGKLIYFCANRFIACGTDAGRALFGQKANFTVINNGIDIKQFEFNETARHKLRTDLGVKSHKTRVLLHVGRFEEQKNHNYLINIFLRYRELNPDSILVLVGDGPLRESVQKQINASKIDGSVRVLGKRSDVNDLYSAADVFVFPSLFEGLPVVLIEIQANGLSALISDTIDTEVKLTPGVHFKSIEDSPRSWARALEELSSVRYSKEGKAMSGGVYDIASVVLDLYNIYKSTDRKLTA